MFESFHDLVIGKLNGSPKKESLGKLDVFAVVGEFPARVKCATLPWHTLTAALEDKPERLV